MKLGRGVWSEYKARVALVAVITASLASTAQAQQLNLGEVSFSTSARSVKAQTHFLRGVAALHSFARSGQHEEARAYGQQAGAQWATLSYDDMHCGPLKGTRPWPSD